MRAMVTGAAGFVGSSVVRELLRQGFAVRALVRKGGDRQNLGGLDVEIVEGDVRDFDAAASAVSGCRYIFHLAALYSQSESDADRMYEVNVEGTKNLLDAARKFGFQSRPYLERFVHTSTVGTIGRPDNGSLPGEDCPFNLWESSSHYVLSKYLGERAALSAWEDGLPVTIVHPCAPAGPGDVKPSVTGQRVVDFMLGKMPSFVAGGINFVDVEDVAKGHILAATKGRPGGRYILGNRNLSRDEFLSLMQLVTGYPAPRPSRHRFVGKVRRYLQRVPPGLSKDLRPKPRLQGTSPGTEASAGSSAGYGGPFSLACDCSRSVKELDLPQTPLELALERAADWFRERGYVDKRGQKGKGGGGWTS